MIPPTTTTTPAATSPFCRLVTDPSLSAERRPEQGSAELHEDVEDPNGHHRDRGAVLGELRRAREHDRAQHEPPDLEQIDAVHQRHQRLADGFRVEERPDVGLDEMIDVVEIDRLPGPRHSDPDDS